MRRLPLAAALLVLGTAPAGAAAPKPTPKPTPPPSRAQVSADEFTLALSRPAVRRGTAIIELVNYGEDDHDLALRRLGGTRTWRIGVVAPGRTGELAGTLRPGRYLLWCTLGDHRARGMVAALRVR